MTIQCQSDVKGGRPEGLEEDRLWTFLLSDLLRLSRIYQRRGDARRVLRCEAALKALEAALTRHGSARGLSRGELLSAARLAATTESPAPEQVQEARAWWNSFGASFHLASKVSLRGGAPDLALRLTDVHRQVRAVIQCVYPDAAEKELFLRSATLRLDGEEGPFQDWGLRHLMDRL